MVGADPAAIWAARPAAARASLPFVARHHGQLPEATAVPHRASVRQLVVSRPGHAQTRVRTMVVGCPASAHSASARQIAARP